MDELEIAFDTKEKFEYFIKYTPVKYTGELLKDKRKNYYIFLKKELVPKKLGTFLLAFLNTNFNTFNACKNFIYKYLFINLLLKVNKNIFIDSQIHENDCPAYDCYNLKPEIILSKEEINFYLEKTYKLYKAEFIRYQNIYISIVNHKYRKSYCKCLTQIVETYSTALKMLSPTIIDLKVGYSVSQFYGLYNSKNIKNSYISPNFYAIIYISFKELTNYRKNIEIRICKNCNKYFIPDTAHNTKYCDSLFDGKRTCKEIGPMNTHIKTIENDHLLKRYRNRYKELAKQASNTSPNSPSNQMYAYYKKEGPTLAKQYKKGLISAEEFKAFLDSTYLR